MLFRFNKGNNNLSPLAETNFKSHNILERQDIESWVESFPEILGEEILILSTEYDKFDKTNERIDLLGLDKDGNVVVIELKRDDSGKNVELQAIKYAAYCSTLTFEEVVNIYFNYHKKSSDSLTREEAKSIVKSFITNEEFEEINDKPRIIIVAKDFRTEVTTSILWLRKFGLDITCVKLIPYVIDEENLGIESNVLIPLPEAEDYLVRSEAKENVEHTRTITQQEYLNFYTKLSGEFQRKMALILPTPSTKSYFQIPTGISCVHFEWCFHGRPRSSFGVEIHFEKGQKDANLRFIEEIERNIEKIEIATHEKVILQKAWGARWSRAYIEKKSGEMTDENLNWGVDKMAIFHKILFPVIQKCKNMT